MMKIEAYCHPQLDLELGPLPHPVSSPRQIPLIYEIILAVQLPCQI